MEFTKKLALMVVILMGITSGAFAAQEQIRVNMHEYVDQTVTYNPLETGDGIWFDTNVVS